MRVFEDPTLGVMLVAPTPLLRSLLLRIISLRNPSNPTTKEASASGEGPETPEIVLQPLITETIEWLTNPLNGVSPSPILVICAVEAFQALAALEGPDVEEYQELLDVVFRAAREGTPGRFIATERETSAAFQGESLSPRELEVLEQLTLGSSNNQIAQVLSISPNTVYTHVRNIKAKLRTSNRTQTALLARTMLRQS